MSNTEVSKHPLLRAPRPAGARNICVGFAHVGVNLAHMSPKCYAHNSRTMCVYVARVHVTRTCRARSAQQGIIVLLLDPSVFKSTRINALRRPECATSAARIHHCLTSLILHFVPTRFPSFTHFLSGYSHAFRP
jgi:hypothetical protein